MLDHRSLLQAKIHPFFQTCLVPYRFYFDPVKISITDTSKAIQFSQLYNRVLQSM